MPVLRKSLHDIYLADRVHFNPGYLSRDINTDIRLAKSIHHSVTSEVELEKPDFGHELWTPTNRAASPICPAAEVIRGRVPPRQRSVAGEY